MTLTKLKKFKISKMFMVLLAIAAISFAAITTIWAIKTNTLVDTLREGGIKNRAVVATSFAWLSIVTASLGLLAIRKKANIKILFLFIVITTLLIFLAYILPLGDQKDFKNAMNTRQENFDAYFAASDAEKMTMIEHVQRNPQGPLGKDLIAFMGKSQFLNMSVQGVSISAFTPAFEPFLTHFSEMLENATVKAQANLYVASIAVFSTISGVIVASAGFIFLRNDKLTAQAK